MTSELERLLREEENRQYAGGSTVGLDGEVAASVAMEWFEQQVKHVRVFGLMPKVDGTYSTIGCGRIPAAATVNDYDEATCVTCLRRMVGLSRSRGITDGT